MTEMQEVCDRFNNNKEEISADVIESVNASYSNKKVRDAVMNLVITYYVRSVPLRQLGRNILCSRFEGGPPVLHIMSKDNNISLARIRANYICSFNLVKGYALWSDNISPEALRYPALVHVKKKLSPEDRRTFKEFLNHRVKLKDMAHRGIIAGLYCYATGYDKVVIINPAHNAEIACGFNISDVYWNPANIPLDRSVDQMVNETNTFHETGQIPCSDWSSVNCVKGRRKLCDSVKKN
jgi:hypothetical protein